MIRAYHESYLSEAMNGMGAMLDYAVNACGEDLRLFYARFLSSSVAQQLERGNPRYLSGLSGVELAGIVAEQTGRPLNAAEPLIDMGSPEYWTGWALAYLQWFHHLSFKALQAAGVGAMSLLEKYPALHEADLSKVVSFSLRAIESYRAGHGNPLKRFRKSIHLTQQDLAGQSGISLRAIRAYEQGQIPLSSASAETIFTLARILGCTPGDLLF